MKAVFLAMSLVVGMPVMAGSVPPVADTVTASVTNSHSVFIMPASAKDGRDPFFPSSTRPYQTAVLANTPAVDLNLNLLVMQGISGMPPNRLVVINKHTFAKGDYASVSTSQGRIHIHCLEINANSVVIEANGQRHELRYEEKQ